MPAAAGRRAQSFPQVAGPLPGAQPRALTTRRSAKVLRDGPSLGPPRCRLCAQGLPPPWQRHPHPQLLTPTAAPAGPAPPGPPPGGCSLILAAQLPPRSGLQVQLATRDSPARQMEGPCGRPPGPGEEPTAELAVLLPEAEAAGSVHCVLSLRSGAAAGHRPGRRPPHPTPARGPAAGLHLPPGHLASSPIQHPQAGGAERRALPATYAHARKSRAPGHPRGEKTEAAEEPQPLHTCTAHAHTCSMHAHTGTRVYVCATAPACFWCLESSGRTERGGWGPEPGPPQGRLPALSASPTAAVGSAEAGAPAARPAGMTSLPARGRHVLKQMPPQTRERTRCLTN